MKQLDDGLLALFYGLKSKTLRKPDASLQANVGIPVGEAREYFLGGELLFRGFQSFRFKDFEPDPNAAMIARDEPKFATGGYVGQKCRYELAPMEFFKPSIFERLGDHDGKRKFRVKFGGKSKPAITGLTTVHDGKVNGLGFCSDLGHE